MSVKEKYYIRNEGETYSLKYGYRGPRKPAAKKLNLEDQHTSDEFHGAYTSLDRRARVNISVSPPTYDGKKGGAAKFVSNFIRLMENQRNQEEEWDALLMDCLKKEALKHFGSTRDFFDSSRDYFSNLIQFFDNRFLTVTKQLQTLKLFPALDEEDYHKVFMDDFFTSYMRKPILLSTAN